MSTMVEPDEESTAGRMTSIHGTDGFLVPTLVLCRNP